MQVFTTNLFQDYVLRLIFERKGGAHSLQESANLRGEGGGDVVGGWGIFSYSQMLLVWNIYLHLVKNGYIQGEM